MEGLVNLFNVDYMKIIFGDYYFLVGEFVISMVLNSEIVLEYINLDI